MIVPRVVIMFVISMIVPRVVIMVLIAMIVPRVIIVLFFVNTAMLKGDC